MASVEKSVTEGIFSLLDTDLYKLTMQCVVLKYFPTAGECGSTVGLTDNLLTHAPLEDVEYAFTNRTPEMRLNRPAFTWLQEQTASE